MRATSTGNGTRVHLVDIQTVENNFYYWADQAVSQVPAVLVPGAAAQANYLPWLLTPPTVKRSRSITAETASLRIQNVSGTTVNRDFQGILRASAMEGALCVYRFFNIGAGTADLQFTGRVSVGDVSSTEASLSLSDIYDFAGTDAPGMTFSETCQLIWGLPRCGATGTVECKYSQQTCQVPERFTGIENTFYDKNFAEAIGAVSTTVINRRRRI